MPRAVKGARSGAGRWATAENRRINTDKTTWEGTVNGGNYYGNFYSENSEVYSGEE